MPTHHPLEYLIEDLADTQCVGPGLIRALAVAAADAVALGADRIEVATLPATVTLITATGGLRLTKAAIAEPPVHVFLLTEARTAALIDVF